MVPTPRRAACGGLPLVLRPAPVGAGSRPISHRRKRAARHDRPRATPQAPGHDVPLVTVAGAPGHGRPSAAQLVPDHHRSHPAPMAPPGHALARAGTYVPITTAPLPARVSRLLQAVLPRVPATPNTRTYSHSHRLTRHSHRLNRHSRESGNPRPPVTTGGAQGDYVPPTRAPSLRRKPQSTGWPYADRRTDSPSLPGKGPGVRSKSLPNEKPTLMSRPSQDSSAGAITTTHQVHPAIQVPPRPRSCSTTGTGVSRQHHSRAPPIPTHRKSTPVRPSPSPRGRGLG